MNLNIQWSWELYNPKGFVKMIDIPMLFVDDNILSSLEPCDFLRNCGFNVFDVAGASDAFEVIDRRGPLTALVTDIDLGAGMNGYDVAHRARASYPHLAVVFISGSARGRHATEGVLGSEFIAKPYASQHLVDAVRRVIHLAAA